MGTCLTKHGTSHNLETEFDSPDNGYITFRHMRNNQGFQSETNLHQPVSPSPYAGTRTRSEEIKAMVDVFRPLILDSVNVCDIQPLIGQFIDDAERFRNGTSNRESMGCLLDALETSTKDGKWQGFLDALETAGYPYIVSLLNGHTDKDLNCHRQLLQLLQPVLKDNLDLNTYLGKLFSKGVLNRVDMERIKCETDRHGETAGCLMLLSCLPNRTEDWFEVFRDTLRESGRGDIAKQLEVDDGSIAPPSKCRMIAGGSGWSHFSDRSYLNIIESPPPDYQDDELKSERDKNERKIQRLKDTTQRKKEILDQRVELKKLRSIHKELNEQLDADPPVDDSSSETSLKDVRFELYAEEDNRDSCYDEPDECSAAEPAIQPTANFESGPQQGRLEPEMSASGNDADSNFTQRGPFRLAQEAPREPARPRSDDKAGGQQSPENADMDDIKVTLQVLVKGQQDMRQDINRLSERTEVLVRQCQALHQLHAPPPPHNLHMADSAFSDCSVVSITSF